MSANEKKASYQVMCNVTRPPEPAPLCHVTDLQNKVQHDTDIIFQDFVLTGKGSDDCHLLGDKATQLRGGNLMLCALISKTSASFLGADNFQSHVKLPFFWCDLCPFESESKANLLQHLVSQHCFVCRYCSYMALSRCCVVQHSMTQHHQFLHQFQEQQLKGCYLKLCEFQSCFQPASSKRATQNSQDGSLSSHQDDNSKEKNLDQSEQEAVNSSSSFERLDGTPFCLGASGKGYTDQSATTLLSLRPDTKICLTTRVMDVGEDIVSSSGMESETGLEYAHTVSNDMQTAHAVSNSVLIAHTENNGMQIAHTVSNGMHAAHAVNNGVEPDYTVSNGVETAHATSNRVTSETSQSKSVSEEIHMPSEDESSQRREPFDIKEEGMEAEEMNSEICLCQELKQESDPNDHEFHDALGKLPTCGNQLAEGHGIPPFCEKQEPGELLPVRFHNIYTTSSLVDNHLHQEASLRRSSVSPSLSPLRVETLQRQSEESFSVQNSCAAFQQLDHCLYSQPQSHSQPCVRGQICQKLSAVQAGHAGNKVNDIQHESDESHSKWDSNEGHSKWDSNDGHSQWDSSGNNVSVAAQQHSENVLLTPEARCLEENITGKLAKFKYNGTQTDPDPFFEQELSKVKIFNHTNKASNLQNMGSLPHSFLPENEYSKVEDIKDKQLGSSKLSSLAGLQTCSTSSSLFAIPLPEKLKSLSNMSLRDILATRTEIPQRAVLTRDQDKSVVSAHRQLHHLSEMSRVDQETEVVAKSSDEEEEEWQRLADSGEKTSSCCQEQQTASRIDSQASENVLSFQPTTLLSDHLQSQSDHLQSQSQESDSSNKGMQAKGCEHADFEYISEDVEDSESDKEPEDLKDESYVPPKSLSMLEVIGAKDEESVILKKASLRSSKNRKVFQIMKKRKRMKKTLHRIKEPESLFRCPFCSHPPATAESLKNHIRHVADNRHVLMVKSAELPETVHYICPGDSCSSTFPAGQAYLMHVMQCQGHVLDAQHSSVTALALRALDKVQPVTGFLHCPINNCYFVTRFMDPMLLHFKSHLRHVHASQMLLFRSVCSAMTTIYSAVNGFDRFMCYCCNSILMDLTCAVSHLQTDHGGQVRGVLHVLQKEDIGGIMVAVYCLICCQRVISLDQWFTHQCSSKSTTAYESKPFIPQFEEWPWRSQSSTIKVSTSFAAVKLPDVESRVDQETEVAAKSSEEKEEEWQSLADSEDKISSCCQEQQTASRIDSQASENVLSFQPSTLLSDHLQSLSDHLQSQSQESDSSNKRMQAKGCEHADFEYISENVEDSESDSEPEDLKDESYVLPKSLSTLEEIGFKDEERVILKKASLSSSKNRKVFQNMKKKKRMKKSLHWIKESESLFRCPFCSHPPATAESLKNHIRHVADNRHVLMVKSAELPGPWHYICPGDRCSSTFPTGQAYLMHVMQCQGHVLDAQHSSVTALALRALDKVQPVTGFLHCPINNCYFVTRFMDPMQLHFKSHVQHVHASQILLFRSVCSAMATIYSAVNGFDRFMCYCCNSILMDLTCVVSHLQTDHGGQVRGVLHVLQKENTVSRGIMVAVCCMKCCQHVLSLDQWFTHQCSSMSTTAYESKPFIPQFEEWPWRSQSSTIKVSTSFAAVKLPDVESHVDQETEVVAKSSDEEEEEWQRLADSGEKTSSRCQEQQTASRIDSQASENFLSFQPTTLLSDHLQSLSDHLQSQSQESDSSNKRMRAKGCEHSDYEYISENVEDTESETEPEDLNDESYVPSEDIENSESDSEAEDLKDERYVTPKSLSTLEVIGAEDEESVILRKASLRSFKNRKVFQIMEKRERMKNSLHWIKEPESLFRCPFCSHPPATAESLKNHIRHVADNRHVLMVKSVELPETLHYICPGDRCSSTFPAGQAYLMHVMQCQGHVLDAQHSSVTALALRALDKVQPVAGFLNCPINNCYFATRFMDPMQLHFKSHVQHVHASQILLFRSVCSAMATIYSAVKGFDRFMCYCCNSILMDLTCAVSHLQTDHGGQVRGVLHVLQKEDIGGIMVAVYCLKCRQRVISLDHWFTHQCSSKSTTAYESKPFIPQFEEWPWRSQISTIKLSTSFAAVKLPDVESSTQTQLPLIRSILLAQTSSRSDEAPGLFDKQNPSFSQKYEEEGPKSSEDEEMPMVLCDDCEEFLPEKEFKQHSCIPQVQEVAQDVGKAASSHGSPASTSAPVHLCSSIQDDQSDSSSVSHAKLLSVLATRHQSELVSPLASKTTFSPVSTFAAAFSSSSHPSLVSPSLVSLLTQLPETPAGVAVASSQPSRTLTAPEREEGGIIRSLLTQSFIGSRSDSSSTLNARNRDTAPVDPGPLQQQPQSAAAVLQHLADDISGRRRDMVSPKLPVDSSQASLTTFLCMQGTQVMQVMDKVLDDVQDT